MDKNKIIELENLIYKVQEKAPVAASTMANILGVLVDLKPAMLGDFSEDELKRFKIEEFKKLLDELGLESVFFEHRYLQNGEEITLEDFCISKKKKLAERTRQAFNVLWSTIDDNGEVINQRKWVKISKKIGKLLGYPKTAIDDFAKTADADDEDRVKRMNRYRYYAHSAEHEESEFRSYDLKLNKAISEFAPKTADLFSSNKEKRWLD